MAVADRSVTDNNLDKATLLFVDDERRVLTSMRAMFRREYHVFVAEGGQEALDIIDQEQIDVVISDQRMPNMTGVEFLSAVKEQSPSIMRILLTGYADLDAIEASINEGEVFRYLMKPCPPEDLRKAIAMAVDAVRTELSALEDEPAVEEIELQPVDRTESQPAELIPFPVSRRSSKRRASVHPIRPPKEKDRQPPKTKERAIPSPDVGVLVLSVDRALYQTINEVVEGAQVVRAASVDQALGILEEQRIGVMVTDITTDQPEVESLTKRLKLEVPELVTIIASERSDAQTLISLINEGQIFRFLLKPLSRGQSRLWMASAIRKFAELTRSEEHLARYRVSKPAEGFLGSIQLGWRQLRARLKGR